MAIPICRSPGWSNRRLVINSGSIGMPYGRAGGSWAVLRNGDISVRRTEIDVEDGVGRVVVESGYPDRQEWVDYFVRSTSSDVEGHGHLRTPRRPRLELITVRRCRSAWSHETADSGQHGPAQRPRAAF